MASTVDAANQVVRQAIDAAIAARNEIGVQVAAYHRGKLVIDVWGGLADPQRGIRVDGDTLFNVFSVTKAIVATAVHVQAEKGFIDYDERVAHYWPEYGAHGKERTTVRDVLTHRACVPQMPEGMTPERLCDWEWMCRQIAALMPLAEPGTKTMYLPMTFGWILGEIVRRSDPTHRSLGRFVREEIAQPLGITDLWIGIPDEVEPRIAKLTNASPPMPPENVPALYRTSKPPAVDLVPEVFERRDVRRAEVAGVGGIFNARSCGRFWAMLANGGELDGVRILSADRVAGFNTPRPRSDERDPVLFNTVLPISIAGFWLGRDSPPMTCVHSPRAFGHPGAGNTVAWADPDQNLAVSICHNRMFNPPTRDADTLLPIANAVRRSLGLPAV